MAKDLDYLTARLHGRRSRLAEASQLDALCRVRSVPELARAACPGTEFPAAADFQRRLVQDLIDDLSGFLAYVTGAGARLLAWMLVRFQVENVKVLIRGFATRAPMEVLDNHLARLPKDLALDTPGLGRARSLEEFIRRLPPGTLRESVEEFLVVDHAPPKPFFLEAALDRGYFRELLARVEDLSGPDKEVIEALVVQEVDSFHLMLVARGKFHYGLAPEQLLPLHLEGTGISRARFAAMLGDPDLLSAASRAVGPALEAVPARQEPGEASATVDPAALEALAWNRFLLLANRAFRRSHMGLGAVVGYAGIRRVEVANLITLSEGIRAGTAPEAIRARLIPRSGLEAAHV